MSVNRNGMGKDSCAEGLEGSSAGPLVGPGWRFPINPRVCLALAGQTFRYCVRRKVLLVLGLFVAFMVVSYLVAPKSFPLKVVELVIRASLMATSFCAVIVMVFLSATVLPEDITNRTIYTLLTKPVGRLNYLLGRTLGFSAVALVLLLVMGLVSVAFIRFSAWKVGLGTDEVPMLQASRHACPQRIMFRARPDLPDELPRVEAKTGQSILSGDQPRALVFHFRGSALKGRPDDVVTVAFRVEVQTGARLPKCDVEVVARNPVTGATDIQTTQLDSQRQSHVTFDAAVADAGEGMEIQLRRTSPGVILTTLDGVTVLLEPALFEVAYAKALLAVFFGLVVLIVIGLMASAYVSKWLAVVMAFSAYLAGVFSEVFRDLIVKLSSGGAMKGFLGTDMFGPGGQGGDAPPSGLVSIINQIYLRLFEVITIIIPDFRLFDAGSYVVNGNDVPGLFLTAALFWAAIYCLVYLVVAQLLWHRREVGL